jgi:flavin-dependent dehydrogenase
LRLSQHLGLDPADVKSWQAVEDIAVVAADGRRVDLPLPRDGSQFAASAKRADLDAALVDVALRSGAQVMEGNPVDHAQRRQNGSDGVDLDLQDGTRVAAHYVIAADGAWSPLRKSLGLGDTGYLGDWQAGRMYYENVGPAAERLWVWFEPDMVPGYAWSFPLAGGAANVGYGVIRKPGQPLGELKGQRIDFMERPHVAEVLGPHATPIGGWKGWPIPARIGDTSLTGLGGRVIFVGDAARACDPMTGEGIAQAFETAIMAAQATASAGPDRPAQAERAYQRSIRWGMAIDDRLARFLSGVLAHPTGSTKALAIVDCSDWCRRNFVRWMFEDYPRAALATPHRWRRHMFSRSGAFGHPSSG